MNGAVRRRGTRAYSNGFSEALGISPVLKLCAVLVVSFVVIGAIGLLTRFPGEIPSVAGSSVTPTDSLKLSAGSHESSGFVAGAMVPSGSSAGWVNISAGLSNLPPPRSNASAVWDAADGYYVLFGGEHAGKVLGDTWAFQNGRWSEVASTVTPPARYGAGMAFDAEDHCVVLFGGANSSSILVDTWTFAAGQWHHPKESSTPRARLFPSMAFDDALSSVIMFGGMLPGNATNQSASTWRFSGGLWSLANLGGGNSSPADRVAGTMFYDNATKDFVMFGGWDPETVNGPFQLSDTWLYAFNSSSGGYNWTKANAPVHPSGRFGASATYDPTESAVVLFGGENLTNGQLESDTWLWKNGSWTNITDSLNDQPSPRVGAAMATSELPGGTYFAPLLVGGWMGPAGDSNDTWFFGNLPLSVLPPRLTAPVVDVGVAVTIFVTAFGGSPGGYGYTWAGLPSSCLTTNSSQIECTPSSRPTTGSYGISVLVTDSGGTTVDSAVTNLSVTAPPSVTEFTALPSPAAEYSTLTVTVQVSGGVGGFTYTYAGLPPGCVSKNESSFSCNPQATGSFTLTVEVADAEGLIANSTTHVSVTTAGSGGSQAWEYLVEALIGIVAVAIAVAYVRRGFRSQPPRPSSSKPESVSATSRAPPDSPPQGGS